MHKYILGFDIGGTKCAVNLAAVNNGIELIDKINFPTETEKGFKNTLDNLISSGREIIKRNNISENIMAIGISCGGPLDTKTGSVFSPPHLPGWDNIPICGILSQEFNIPAYLQNDANACALVEWYIGAGRGARNMIFITMGTGFGAGIIAEGKLIEGASCLAGEIGHVRLEPDGPVLYGKAGSVEAYVSGEGISLHGGGLDVKTIAESARAGDKTSQELFMQTGRRLGKALAVLLDILNPECIVIGGIFTRCEDLLHKHMELSLAEEALPGTLKNFRVLPAETGESIGDYASIAAACYAMGINIVPVDKKINENVRFHLNSLLKRYPILKCCEQDILNVFYILRSSFKNGKKLLCCGNGGSASDCGHIAGELMKGFLLQRKPENKGLQKLQKALPTIDLTQHNALSTAFLNDVDPNLVFAQQVFGYGMVGDALLCISTSGNAKNVIEAAKTANNLGISVISLTGAGGGDLFSYSDVSIRVPGHSTPEVQELHLPVYHCICAMLEAEFFV